MLGPFLCADAAHYQDPAWWSSGVSAAQGLATAAVTLLEIGYTARSHEDHEQYHQAVLQRLQFVYGSPRSERRAIDVQQRLMARGHHRTVKLPDLLVAAIAETDGMTVLHYDADFDRVGEVTGQPTQWVVDAGSVP